MNNKKIKYIMPLLLIMLLFTTCSQKKSSSTGSTQTQQYTLTVNVYPSGSGRVVLSPSGGVYTAGTVVELTAIPNSGYTFNMWGGDLSGSQNPTTITMNSNKTVIAQFVSGGGSGGTTTYYTLTVNISPTGGGNVVKNPDKQQYTAGESVVVGAIPSSGYQFLNWSGDISSTDNPLNVTITTNIVLTANFQQLSGGGTTYSLSVNVSPQGAGTVSLNPAGGSYTAGTQVTLTATPSSGYVFSNWTGDLTGTTNPATITMNSNKTVTAVFTQQQVQQYTLTTSVSPQGAGTVSLNPAGGSYTAGTQVTLTATPSSGYVFSNWTGDLTGTTNPATITMNSNKTVVANFSGSGSGGTTYSLSVSVSPQGAGTVSLNPAGGVYTAGTQVTLTATANSGYVFSSWSGDLSGTTNPATITMDSNKTVTAVFTQQQQQQYTLTTSVSPTGAGTVSLNPAGGSYTAGTQVTLTATPNSGYVFSNWTGDLTGTTNPVTITMNSNKTVTAVFTQQQVQQYTLTTTVSPANAGTISLNPPGGVYTAGQVVTITAQANSGYRFVNWSGDVTGTSNPTTVEMNANKTVTANFESTSDTARYSFETGVQGWVAQTYVDSQAITNVARDTTRAKYGSASLRCTVDLRGGHANYSKGETYVELQTAQNLSNATVTLWVWIPSEAVAVPPNGIQVFFKDSSWSSKYSSWKNIGNEIITNEWVQITVNTATEQWGYDEGANLSQVKSVGVKIGTGGQSTATFSGYIWIDSVNW
jgi:uncharacterized repeat protein (TIGR02543 family)